MITAGDAADSVDACLRAVLGATAGLDREIVVVDLASSDDTAARAAAHPVRVLRITDDEWATPAAGAYLGTVATGGDHVLVLGADERLSSEWLAAARERLAAEPSLAGVGGWIGDRPVDARRRVRRLSGPALYDRTALDAVGGPDPALATASAVDLGIRLRSAGYRLCRLSVPASDGRSDSPVDAPAGPDVSAEGLGRLLRKALARPSLLPGTLSALRVYLVAVVWVSIAAVAMTRRGRSGLRTVGEVTAGGLAWHALERGPGATLRLVVRVPSRLVSIAREAARPGSQPAAFPIDRVEPVTDADGWEPTADGRELQTAGDTSRRWH